MARPNGLSHHPSTSRLISRYGHDREADKYRHEEYVKLALQRSLRPAQWVAPNQLPTPSASPPLDLETGPIWVPPQHLPTPASTPSPPPSVQSLNMNTNTLKSADLAAYPMERTPSGSTILHTPPSLSPWPSNTSSTTDAAISVEAHIATLPPDTHAAVILRQILHSPHSITDSNLSSIIDAANTLFFHNALTDRVAFEWISTPRFHHHIIAATALRPYCPAPSHPSSGGYETLILLSAPILKHGHYGRHLTISALLHELVHCYLFIRCGMRGRGHGHGFSRIASMLESWVCAPGGLAAGLGVGRVRVGLEGIGETAVDWDAVDSERGRQRWQAGDGRGEIDGSRGEVECGCTHAIPLKGYDTSPRPVRDYENAGWKRSEGWGPGEFY